MTEPIPQVPDHTAWSIRRVHDVAAVATGRSIG